MKLHRFFVGDEVELSRDFWVHDEKLIHQWRNVLRMSDGQELVLFDGIGEDRLYKLLELTDREAHLSLVTEMKRNTPANEIYLLWSLLKKDKNDWVIQKCTELGVSHFIPIISDRCERSVLSQNQLDRWKKIVIEAAEQCGRSDIPAIREPINIDTAITELSDKMEIFVCQQSDYTKVNGDNANEQPVGVLIGPEGGWSDEEKQLFKTTNLKHLNLHDFTLRAETAAISAISLLNK